MITLVDTDFLLGLTNPFDAHYKKAVSLLGSLVQFGIDPLILPTTLCEYALLASSRIGVSQTKKAISQFTQANYITPVLNEDFTQQSITKYLAQTSKEESLFDCFIMVASTVYQAECIASFDRGYTKNGLLLVSDFVKGKN